MVCVEDVERLGIDNKTYSTFPIGQEHNMIDKEFIVTEIQTGRYCELLMWNGENFWDGENRILIQGNKEQLLAAFHGVGHLYDCHDLGSTLCRIVLN